MIATIAAIAEKKKFSDRSDHSDHENENDFHTIAELHLNFKGNQQFFKNFR